MTRAQSRFDEGVKPTEDLLGLKGVCCFLLWTKKTIVSQESQTNPRDFITTRCVKNVYSGDGCVFWRSQSHVEPASCGQIVSQLRKTTFTTLIGVATRVQNLARRVRTAASNLSAKCRFQCAYCKFRRPSAPTHSFVFGCGRSHLFLLCNKLVNVNKKVVSLRSRNNFGCGWGIVEKCFNESGEQVG